MVRQSGGTAGAPPVVRRDMAAVIDRVLAVYSAATLLTVVPVAVDLRPVTKLWWLLVFGGGLVVAAGWMIALALLRRPLAPAAAAYALLVPLGYVAQHWGVAENAVEQAGVLSGAVGVAVVCAGLWRGGRFAVAYAVVTAALLVAERTGARGGSLDPAMAVGEGLFSVGAGLGVLAVALGMMRAAEAADRLAERVRRQEVDLAVEQAVAAERARLDQVVHDDVMTTLSAASRAADAAGVAAVVRLAKETVATIDRLRPSTGAREPVPTGVLHRLLVQACARISPRILVTDTCEGPLTALVAPAAAEAGLSAVREALRNAVRHAGARRVELLLSRAPGPDGGEELRVRVLDDGVGFDPATTPLERLGLRVSMGEALDRVGIAHRLSSSPGRGTEFTMAWAGRVPALPAHRAAGADSRDPGLPARFPVGRMVGVVWAVTVGMVAIGCVLLPRTVGPWSPLAMVTALGLTAVVLHAGRGLVLPARATTAAVLLVAATTLGMALAAPVTGDPSVVAWHRFPLQLVLAVLVLRRRRPAAALGLLVVLAGNAVWWLRGDLPVAALLVADFGPVVFFAMALVVDASLARIARRQVALRAQERAVVDEAVRGSVAELQGALWAADLKARARLVLGRIAALDAPPSAALVREALLLEARLREEMSARNVMNEELSSLTDDARRRGVDVRVVDSRETPAPPRLARALIAEVRASLASGRLSRLVVRLAPAAPPGERRTGPGWHQAASVLAQSETGTTHTTLDDDGEPEHPPGRSS